MNERMYGQVGEKRNMSALEKKVDALLQFCTAQTEEDRGRYHLHLQNLMNTQDSLPLTAEIQKRIDKMLADLGIPDHLYGYRYLLTAIDLCLEEPLRIHCITCEVYPAVALRHGTNAAAVERGIRHAIECGWTRCSLEMQEKYFGGKVNPERCKPTNSEFIARVTNLLRRPEIVS